ncbi:MULTISPECIES: LacI family DNA-binding transcriptional regulator [Paenibacillus]|uniref:LacI family DNA-binding transcriptional regulator n=1 Tax=Paenibacillus TaxID=44249 RepID=UPI0022B88047|nr:LacI family DNA-binding transcriptional regulator [Paenibacillus caseinilyticus]MCZ8517937.1 LacI family DNA-binding transcriptional regulator [Paenibacillus caseinilyticus]
MKQMTIYDIASEAGVSVATVSRVLNNTAPVKESTRFKIMELIDKYQFQPNALARSLTKKETGTVGVIVPDITNPFFPEVFSGIEREARDMGYTFFLCDTLGDYERESQYLHILREKQVDGIIFLGGRINLTKCSPALVHEVVETAARIPLVLVNGSLPGTSLHRVVTDESKGAEMATQYLVDIGHTDIAFIAGNDNMTTTAQKVRAYKRVMARNGLEVPKDRVLFGDFSMASGERSMEIILNQTNRPSAVLCVNDYTAVGAVKAAMKSGIAIPAEMSIVGFDDIPLASAIYPELTTVKQQMETLGGTSVHVLHKLIMKERVKKVTVIEPELVVRQSTKRR